MSEILQVKNLSVSFFTPHGEVEAVRDVTFSLQSGEVLAVVGESGCGKTALCKSIMKLLPDTARIKSGSIAVCGADITDYTDRDMRKLRGRLYSMILQNPMTALDPTVPVGRQVAEAVLVHHPRMDKEAVRRRVLELMTLVGLDNAQARCQQYPHSLSGGMLQRCVLAIALAGEPQILFADEPTTALDVTVQAQILDLLREIQQRLGTATVLVTHDFGVVARAADRVAVMYAGRIVEIGTAEDIFYDPRHPYTVGLLRSLPYFAAPGEPLYTVPGMPPTMIDPPPGDAFAPRNVYALEIDYQEAPPMFQISDTHFAAAWLLDPRAPRVDLRAGGVRRG
ncbi:MAG: ABC transporter ATP-binding protein [Clostridia bacterium]|nr:ABC transporter ATP-binding protein [Clostridia bacterium]